jgi:hypothetical protein
VLEWSFFVLLAATDIGKSAVECLPGERTGRRLAALPDGKDARTNENEGVSAYAVYGEPLGASDGGVRSGNEE